MTHRAMRLLPRAGLGMMPPADALAGVLEAAENARPSSGIAVNPTRQPAIAPDDSLSVPSSVAPRYATCYRQELVCT